MTDYTFTSPRVVGGLRSDPSDQPVIPGGVRYTASAVGDGLAFSFEKGLLARGGFRWLAADFLLEGTELAVLSVELAEGEAGPRGEMHFGLLNFCQARARIPLTFASMNRWMHDREAGYLKPCATGRHIRLDHVDRLTVTVLRKGPSPVTFSMGPLRATVDEPAQLDAPILPKGVLIDELGQSTVHGWPMKSQSVDEVVARLKGQLAEAPARTFPAGFSRWGGWADAPKRLAGTGFFRTHFEETGEGPLGGRWWLIDPDGFPFWSAGQDCVGPRGEANYAGLRSALAWLPEKSGPFADAFGQRPDHVSFPVINYIRAFGRDWHAAWSKIVLSQLRGWGFNTMANWSDWRIAKAGGFPYVRPLTENFPTTPSVFRDFPDVFHPNFPADCAAYAKQLEETLGDPALIGYFLMNEPTWGFATETPAAGMLYNTPRCDTRTALAAFLKKKYPTDAALAATWQVPVTFEEVVQGAWARPLTEPALADLAAFSTVMVDMLYRGLTDACRKVDPHHMNLGARYYTVPPDWCLAGMTCFDVFSLNAYSERIPADKYNAIAARLKRPVLAGEWHFGALDTGLAAPGIGHVRTQADRGRAYRIYVEDAATCPACVGVHHFQMYDQSALGRFDGENYNIGFVDVCGRPYEPLAAAAREAHARVYAVRAGTAAPFADAPEYLPRLFI